MSVEGDPGECHILCACMQGQGTSAVVAVQQGGAGAQRSSSGSEEGWIAAGLAGGHVALADARSGVVHAMWRAHEYGLSALAACGQHLLLTASQVAFLSPGVHYAYQTLTAPGHACLVETCHCCKSDMGMMSAAACMQDESLRLWDVRMAVTGHFGGAPACLHAFEGHKEAVAGVAVHGLDAMSFAGQHLGVFSLQARALQRM